MRQSTTTAGLAHTSRDVGNAAIMGVRRAHRQARPTPRPSWRERGVRFDEALEVLVAVGMLPVDMNVALWRVCDPRRLPIDGQSEGCGLAPVRVEWGFACCVCCF